MASDISVFFSQASGTSIIMTSGRERPVISRSSTIISMVAESDLPGSTMGRISRISSPNQSLFKSSSRDFMRDTLPRRVFISPLWHM